MPRYTDGETIESGIRWKRGKFQIFTQPRAADGTRLFVSETLPPSTPLADVRRERDRLIRQHATVAPVDGSLADDMRRHLATDAVRRLASYAQRARVLDTFADMLGRDRARQSVTTADLQTIADGWLVTPTVIVKGKRGRPSAADGLKPATVVKRLMHLQAFYNGVNAAHEHNPVVDVRRPTPSKRRRRDRDMRVVADVLDAMPVYVDVADGEPKRLSRARVYARIFAYTGLPPAIVGALKPHDVDFRARTITTPEREKGEGVEQRTLKYLELADAFSAFADWRDGNMWGPVDPGPINVSVKRAAKRIGIVHDFSLYDLRHSFLTHLYRVTRDLDTVRRFALHAENSAQTLIYTQGAHDDVDSAALDAFAASLVEKRRGAMRAAAKPKRATR